MTKGRGGRASLTGTDDRIALGVFAACLLVALAALATFGADAALPSLFLGAGLALLGAVAASRAPPPPVFWAGAALTLWLGAQAAWTGRLTLAAPELGALAGAAGAFAAGHLAGGETRRARRALMLLSWFLLLVLIAAFVLHASDPDAVLGRPKPYHQGRLTGPFLSANTMATFAAIALVIGLGGGLRAGRGAGGALRFAEAAGRRGLGFLLLTLFAAACLLLTGSRAGLAAGLAGAVVIAAWQGVGQAGSARAGDEARGLAARLPLIIGLAAALAAILATSSGVLTDRLAGVGTDTNGRLVLWQASLAAWREAPLFGHGLGSFTRALAAQVTPTAAPLLSLQGAAHSLPLQWLVQTGLVGTLGGAGVLLLLARCLHLGLRRRRRGRLLVRLGAVALGVALLHGLADYALEVPAVLWLLALLTGLAAGAAGGRTQGTARRTSARGDRRHERAAQPSSAAARASFSHTPRSTPGVVAQAAAATASTREPAHQAIRASHAVFAAPRTPIWVRTAAASGSGSAGQ